MKNKFSIIKKINPYELLKEEAPESNTAIINTNTNETVKVTDSTISNLQSSNINENPLDNAEKITSLKSLFNKKEINRKKTCTFTLKKSNIEFLSKFSKSTNISRSEILDKLIEALTKENQITK